MGIRIVWDNAEKTIVRHVFEGEWTLDDYYQHIVNHHAILDELDHIVDIINDVRGSEYLPKDAVAAIRYAAQRTHPNEGINVIVGASPVVKALLEAIFRVFPDKVTALHTNSIDEAYRMIAEAKAKR